MTDGGLFNESPLDQEGAENKYEQWEKDALIKKALAADNHIKTLENEHKLYREAHNTEETLKKVLDKLDQTNYRDNTNYPLNTPANNSGGNESSNQSVKMEEVQKLILASITENQRRSEAKANVERIRKELQKNWGESYSDKLKSRAKELGVDQKYLESMAEQYPDAFLKIVLPSGSTPSPNTHLPPSSTVGITVGGAELTKYAEYSKLMKENPRLRSDPNFRKRMEAAALKYKDAFFAN